MSAATSGLSWLWSLPIAGLGGVIFGALLTQAKKFLDNDKDYSDKVEFVVSRNREVLRARLGYLADDLTNERSEYALHTLDNEKFVQSRTLELVYCFRRMRRCRLGMTCAYFCCEVVKWSAYVGFALIVGFVLGNLFSRALTVRILEIFGTISVGLCIAGMVLAESCFQLIRHQHKKSQNLDASIPS